jgi:membrane protein DedA with SNARE-associated domain
MQAWIIQAIRSMGVFGVGLLMFLENVFPPLPSEVIMPLAGYLSSTGAMSFWGAVAAGTVGSLAGASLWYAVGRRVTEEQLCRWVERHGAWLAMEPRDVHRAREFFERHGRSGVLFGRLLPVARTLISVPAGFARMPPAPFLLYSAAGTFVWTLALAWAGRILGTLFGEVDRYLGYLTWAVLVVGTGWYAYRVVKLKRAQR